MSAAQSVTPMVLPGPASREHPGDPGTLLFENDRVRVWELVMRPGEICNWHVHEHDHLLVVFEGCLVEALKADGTQGTRNIEDGKVLFMPASPVAEIARNASPDRTLRELIIDLKDPAAAPTAIGMFGFFQPGTATTSRDGVLATLKGNV
jgi:quercetin dioxygenase-like cupin family protein